MNNIKVHQKGFTLIEAIVYIAIISIFFVASINLFWHMKEADLRSISAREIKENSAQALESFKYFIRNAEDIDTGASILDNDDGKLVLNYGTDTKYFEIYSKQIEIGGKTYNIKKLRFNSDGNNYDLTSDHVDVEKFYIENLTYAGTPKTVHIQFDISVPRVSPDKKYFEFMDSKITVGIRKEI